MTTTTTTTTTTLPKNFLSSVLSYEAHGVTRAAILSLIKPQLDEIDGQRKEIRKALAEQIKGLKDVKAACSAANSLCPKVAKADATERKRLERRRSFLRGIIAAQYQDYDIIVDGGYLFPQYEGDAYTREAKEIVAMVARLKDLGYRVPKIELAELAVQLKAVGTDTSVGTAPIISGLNTDILATIAATITGIQETIAAKKVAQG